MATTSADPVPATPTYTSQGNRFHLLIDGAAARAAMLDAIEAARERVWLETFILIPDSSGNAILHALEDAARRGVEVILVADNAASAAFSMRRYRPLQRAGATVLLYNPLPPWRRMGRRIASFLHRDHRKILIADEVGFCGGHNISSRYLTSRRNAYYDMTLRMEGPCVLDLGEVFVQTLAQIGRDMPAALPNPVPIAGGVPAGVWMLDRKHNIAAAEKAMRDLLYSARAQCYLMTAYFFPQRRLINDLKATAARGVDVRIMLIGQTDMPFVRNATRHLYDELLGAGIRIFELWDRKLHAKMVVADGEHFLLGTFDFNRFSAQHSLEVMIAVHDPEMASRLERTFLANAARCREIVPAKWSRRGPVARAVNKGFFMLLNRASKPAANE